MRLRACVCVCVWKGPYALLCISHGGHVLVPVRGREVVGYNIIRGTRAFCQRRSTRSGPDDDGDGFELIAFYNVTRKGRRRRNVTKCPGDKAADCWRGDGAAGTRTVTVDGDCGATPNNKRDPIN